MTLMSAMPERVQAFVALAFKDGLENPLGRALYAYNRKLNACHKDPLLVMRAAKSLTATRWLQHWQAGGSLYALSRTVEQQAAFSHARRERTIEWKLSEADKLRRKIRQARRDPEKYLSMTPRAEEFVVVGERSSVPDGRQQHGGDA